MNKVIQPCLWFDHQAEEAARFDVSVFPDSRVGLITHCATVMPLPEGTVLTDPTSKTPRPRAVSA